MKLSKRISAAFLSAALCLSLLPTIPALAEEEPGSAGVSAVSEAPKASAPEPLEDPFEDFSVHEGRLVQYKGSGGVVVVPEGVVTIAWGAFRDADTVTEVVLPDSVTTIDTYAFDGCTALERITLGSGVTVIGKDSFQNCTALTEITIPDNVTTLGEGAFLGCTSLKRVTVGSGITTVQKNYVFHNCTAIEEMELSPELELSIAVNLLQSASPTHMVIPEGVTGLGYNAGFPLDTSKLVSITFPDSITAIPEKLFQNCRNLERVDLGNGVKTIGAKAFSGCSSLSSVVFSDSLTSIESSAFQDCSSLSAVELPRGLTSIGKNAFQGCSSISAVTLPDSLTTLEDFAFQDCASLTRLTVGKGLTKVGEGVFRGCDRLRDTDNLEELGNSSLEVSYPDFTIDKDGYITAYKGSGGHVVIPEGVVGIYGAYQNGEASFADGPFQGNTAITSITLPDSLTDIQQWMYGTYGRGPFGGCTNLKSITFGDGLETLPDLNGLPSLENVTLPAHVTTIPKSCFYGCTSLKDVTIPSSVTTIEENAFRNTGITSLVIPEGVTSCGPIYEYDQDEGNLLELTLPSTLENRPELTCPSLRKLTLPKNSWAFKGISRADLMEYIKNCPRLEKIVNCPNEFVDDLIASNKALRDNWTNPQSTITPQSDRITRLSNEITAGLTTDYDKARAISQWVVDHIKYDDDYYYAGLKDYSDVPFHPEDILDKGQAVCAGISRLTQALMVAQKIPCLYVLGSAGGAHAWNLALIDGEYLWIDNTWGMDYFGLGVYAISRDHTATGAASFNNVKGPGTLVNATAGSSGAVPPTLTDTPWAAASSWAQAEVEAAITASLVPDALQSNYTDLITRREFCTLMVTLVEQKSGQDIGSYLSAKGLTVINPFTDTADDTVLAAYALGIVKGTSETTFNPGGSITRQEAAAMLQRTGKLLGIRAGESQDFADKAQFGSWAAEGIGYVSSLVDADSGKRVMEGTGGGNFSPLATYSREQAILTALRLYRCA